MVGRNRHGVRDLVDEIQFFNGDLIDFVENVDGGNIDTAYIMSGSSACMIARSNLPVAFNNINKIINVGILLERNIGIVDTVFA